MMAWELHNADCLTVLPTIPAESVNLIFADPPYNIGKAAWDKIPDYLQWCAKWIASCSRVLKRNGAFWVSHSDPRILTDLSRMIEQYGRGLVNWVTWWKHDGARELSKGAFATGLEQNRSFFPNVELLIYHAEEGDWTAQSDQTRGFIFEPLRAYLDGERRRAGVDKIACNVACGFSASAGGMASRHYFSPSQWQLPTPEHYAAMRELFGAGYLTREHADLHREYAELWQAYEQERAQHEHLRYTFNNPGKVSTVWQLPPAPYNGHPTSKPEPLLERIIQTCTNAGDMVLDPFAGSGTTLAVAERLGRNSIGIEMDTTYCELIQRRMATAQPDLFAASST